MPKKYYAVKRGNETGIFEDWETCKKNVHGFKAAVYKSFKTKQEAISFMQGETVKENEKYHESEEEIFFQIKDKNEMIAYIDGSFEQSAALFSYAGIMFYKNKKEEFAFASKDPELISMRNVSGEVNASMYVIKKALDEKMEKITIYYDYLGIENWANGSWNANNHLTRKYRDFVSEAKKDIKIEFVKVRSHTNIKFNEEVDMLAKNAIKKEMEKSIL